MIPRPKFNTVPLSAGLRWRGGAGFRYEEKMDGVWAVKNLIVPLKNQKAIVPLFGEPHRAPVLATVCGELMRDGIFYAFDLVIVDGQDLRPLPLIDRLKILEAIVPQKTETSSCPCLAHLAENEKCVVPLFRPACGNGGEFLEAVLARGGEGVVCKDLSAPFGAPWLKCKRAETWDCVVLEKHSDGKASIHIADIETGESRGWCPCRAAFESVRVGDIVEVSAYGLTSAGKFREPRFVRHRFDKTKTL